MNNNNEQQYPVTHSISTAKPRNALSACQRLEILTTGRGNRAPRAGDSKAEHTRRRRRPRFPSTMPTTSPKPPRPPAPLPLPRPRPRPPARSGTGRRADAADHLLRLARDCGPGRRWRPAGSRRRRSPLTCRWPRHPASPGCWSLPPPPPILLKASSPSSSD